MAASIILDAVQLGKVFSEWNGFEGSGAGRLGRAPWAQNELQSATCQNLRQRCIYTDSGDERRAEEWIGFSCALDLFLFRCQQVEAESLEARRAYRMRIV